MKILVNGKEISKAEANKVYGKERMNDRIHDAIVAFTNDPNKLTAWMDGMEIIVEEV